MRYLSAFTIALLMLIPSSVSKADPPPTPTQVMYSRADLLDRLGPKSYTVDSTLFENFSFDPQIGNAFIDSGSWFNTFMSVLNGAGVGTFLLFLASIVVIVFWLSKQLTALAHKRQISMLENNARATYTEYKSWRRRR